MGTWTVLIAADKKAIHCLPAEACHLVEPNYLFIALSPVGFGLCLRLLLKQT